jgi:SET domain-containing protein
MLSMPRECVAVHHDLRFTTGAMVDDAGEGMKLCNRFMVRNTPTMGRGVFAMVPIAKGDLIGVFPTITIGNTERALIENTVVSQFWFLDQRGGALVAGFPLLLNHSEQPNVGHKFVASPVGEVAEFSAIRAIQESEQLFINYGFGSAEEAAEYFRKDFHRPELANS